MSLVSKLRGAGLLLGVSVLALASTASAAPNATAPPDLAAMALANSDFGAGAKVARQRFIKAQRPATATYARDFGEGTRLGRLLFLAVETETSLYPTPAVAAGEVRDFRQVVSTRRGREIFSDAVASAFTQGTKVKLKRVVTSAPLSLGAGQSSVHVATTFVLERNASFMVHLAFVQTDRVVAMLVLTPMPGQKLTRSQLRQLAQLQSNRLRQGFTVANLAAPAITGTASPTQTLTATSGDWSGAPSAYTYQWSRCDSTATTCTDIAGATAPNYTVTPEDTGSVLRTTVTAKNSVTSASTASAVTGVVT